MNGGTKLAWPTVHVRARTILNAVIRGALPALAAGLVLAGCGSSGGGGSVAASTSAASTASGSSSAGLSAFRTCLEQHGVTVAPGQFAGRPSGSFSPRAFPTGSFTRRAFPTGSGFPRPSFTGTEAAAFAACAKYAPAGFAGGPGGANRTISASALAAFKSCLASNGVKVTGSTASAILSQLRNATGKTAAAVNTCRVLLQPAAPTPAPTPAATSS